MDTMKGLFSDAGGLIDTLKDKITSPSPTANGNDELDSHHIGAAIKKISFGDVGPEMSAALLQSQGGASPLPMDILIIGAGLSGLLTAYRLQQMDDDLKIAVVEATDRVGGRLLTRCIKTAGGEMDFFDLGGQWISKKQKCIMSLFSELGLETYEQDYSGHRILVPVEGKPTAYVDNDYPINILGRYDLNSFIARLEMLRGYLTTDDPSEFPDALEWDAVTLEQFKKSHTWTDGGRQIFDSLVVLSLGVTPRELSLFFFLHLLNTCGGWNNLCNIGGGTAKEMKIKGGAERLCAIIADRVGKEQIYFGDPVVEVNQNDDEYCSIRTKNGISFWAKRVVITVPPKCVERMSFQPNLPLGKESLLNHSFSGKCFKYIVTFDTVFWKNDVISKNGLVINLVDQRQQLQQLKIHGEADIMGYSYVFDATTVNSRPALMGLAFSRKLKDSFEPIEREDFILNNLEAVFGKKVFERIDYTDKYWGEDEFESGYPFSVISPGVFSLNHAMLQRPFMRIHWAGAETSSHWYGHIEGAVASAEKVAKEVYNSLSQIEGEDMAIYTDAEEVRERTQSLTSEDGIPHIHEAFI